MKIPRFIAGILVGFVFCMTLTALAFNYIYFGYPGSSYSSPSIPFYITEDEGHPQYSEYQLLNDPEYWRDLSITAENAANDYLSKEGKSGEVHVHCVGSATGFTIYYSFSGYTSLRQLLSDHKTKDIIVHTVNSSYSEHLEKIIGESTNAPQSEPRSQ